jgi:hypothetical protein
MESGAFRKHADAAQPFLDAVKNFVYGPNVEYDNMWNVRERADPLHVPANAWYRCTSSSTRS